MIDRRRPGSCYGAPVPLLVLRPFFVLSGVRGWPSQAPTVPSTTCGGGAALRPPPVVAADAYDGYDTRAAGPATILTGCSTGTLFLPASRQAGDDYPPLRPFCCSPPVLTIQDRPG